MEKLKSAVQKETERHSSDTSGSHAPPACKPHLGTQAGGGSSSADADDSLGLGWLVVSWNCGGWIRTHEFIQLHYGGLAAYLRRIGAAIFCVQETKMLPRFLRTAEEGRKHGAVVDGFKSFWAFNESKRSDSGFNGVATWIREDVLEAAKVTQATQAVFSDPLDAEGRCLLVEIGGLAVLNVYAPFVHKTGEEGANLGKDALTKKRRFLELLQGRVETLLRAGRRVVVCGDLNLAWRTSDCALGRRIVEVHDGRVVGREEIRVPMEAEGSAWRCVSEIAKSLNTSHAAPAEDLVARMPFLSGLVAAKPFTLGDKEVEAGRAVLALNGQRVSSREHLDHELQKIVTGAGKDTAAQIHVECGLRVHDLAEVAQPSHYRCERQCVELFRAMLMPSGGLVDSFAHVHPQAVDRFTCWHQGMNLRFTNCGARLDYVLVDADTAERLLVATPTAELAGANASHGAETGEAAFNAATNFGRWHGAPSKALFGFGDEAGLSLQRDDMRLNESQFRKAHTGMLYTPPSYSDHIPVCALLRSGPELLAGPAPATSAKDTRKCTPWTAQPSLVNFFGKGVKRPHEEATASQ